MATRPRDAPSRLIFVEGIIGAGKSTTAAFVATQLTGNGSPSRLMPEAGELRVATELAHGFAPWLDLDAESYVARCIRRWRRYVAEERPGQTVTVCDGLLFHGNMTDLLLMDAGRDLLVRYVGELLEATQPLRPALVYLRPRDVREALRLISDARGVDWVGYQVGWKMKSPHAARRSLAGFEGLVALYEEYVRICDDVVERSLLPTLVLRGGPDWPRYEAEILAFLGIARVDGPRRVV